jgi:hypothetical protein
VKQTLLASAWLIVAACSAGQSSPGTRAPSPAPTRGSPAWIVEQYFVRPSFPERRDYLFDELADEADGPTIGAELPAGTEVTYRPIQLLADAAVFAVTLCNRGQVEDWYAFLESRGTEWRMGEIRALALPRFFYMLMDSLSAKPVLPDSEAAVLANMRLVTNSDSALRAYFVAHRAALIRLASAFLESGVTKALAYEGRRAPNTTPPVLAAQLRALSLDAIERDEQQPECIRLVIGGMLDNEVGYFYARAGCSPPAMSPHDIILLDPLDKDWYLYKTT